MQTGYVRLQADDISHTPALCPFPPCQRTRTVEPPASSGAGNFTIQLHQRCRREFHRSWRDERALPLAQWQTSAIRPKVRRVSISSPTHPLRTRPTSTSSASRKRRLTIKIQTQGGFLHETRPFFYRQNRPMIKQKLSKMAVFASNKRGE